MHLSKYESLKVTQAEIASYSALPETDGETSITKKITLAIAYETESQFNKLNYVKIFELKFDNTSLQGFNNLKLSNEQDLGTDV